MHVTVEPTILFRILNRAKIYEKPPMSGKNRGLEIPIPHCCCIDLACQPVTHSCCDGYDCCPRLHVLPPPPLPLTHICQHLASVMSGARLQTTNPGTLWRPLGG